MRFRGNGKDDDHDGYVDDTHGWDFLGGAHGDVGHENLELVRLLRIGKGTPAMQEEYEKAVTRDKTHIVDNIDGFVQVLNRMIVKMQKDTPTILDFKAYNPADGGERQVKRILLDELEKNPDFMQFRKDQIEDTRKHFQDALDYSLNPAFNPRTIVGDDTTNAEEHFYGNNDVEGPDALHGTHVAGIIGAVRNNDIGIKGVADHVWIMSVLHRPDGDERDKDVCQCNPFCY